MKKTMAFGILALVFFAGCGKKAPERPYQADSEQYQFFKTLSDSLGLSYLNPEKAVELITTSDFSIWTFDLMPGLYTRFKRFANNLANLPADQLRSTIEQGAQGEAEKKLLSSLAEREGVAPTDSAVNAQLDRYYQSRGGKENFIKFIEQQGFTLDYVENDVRTQMAIQQYVNDYLEEQINITDEELQAAYAEDKSATVRHILFRTQGKSDAEKDEVKKRAEEILARAKAGEDFAALATEYTEDPGSKDNGGLYEDFPRGQMVQAFDEASFALPVGSISDLVETPYGYHIIKVIDRKKETKPIEEVKAQLESQLKQKERRDTYEAMMEELKEKVKYTEHFDVLG
ncbi:peptidylprolyl isomerase [candidate division KSB1 bacterium]|nr:peptidylprolyl isomerase [candidate division KSB1 bacterium]